MHDPHSPLTARQILETQVPQLAALPDQHHDEAEGENGKESRHAETPIEADFSDPGFHEEGQREAERETVDTHDGGAFRGVVFEAFDYVIDGYRDEAVGREAAQEAGERKYHVVEMVFERGAEEAEGDGEDDESGEPEGMEAVLGLPDATVAAADPERDTVVGEVAVELGGDDAEPEGEEDYGVCQMCKGAGKEEVRTFCVLRRGESVALFFDGGFDEHC